MKAKEMKKELKNLANYYNFKEWRKLLFLHESAVEEINTKLKILNKEFKLIHDYNPIEHIKDRVKNPESIIEKLERKGYEVSIENAKKYINDIAGVRIICSFTSDIYNIYEMIKNQDDIEVLRVKDYIKNPKENGYRSLHLIVQLPIFLTDQAKDAKVEIQIRTIAMDFWASLEHKIYYKYKDDAPEDIPEKLKECADIIKDLDKRMLDIRREIDDYNGVE
ncbi:MAG: GTP pyrophosphokinase [Bacillota bacterium]